MKWPFAADTPEVFMFVIQYSTHFIKTAIWKWSHSIAAPLFTGAYLTIWRCCFPVNL